MTKIETKITFLGQTNALLRKNFTLQKHQISTALCQLMVPIVLIAIIGLFQAIIDNQVQKIDALQPPDTFSRLPVSDTFNDHGTLGLSGIPYFRYTVNSSAYTNPTDLFAKLGQLTVNGSHSGFLGSIPQSNNFLYGAFGNFPHFIKENNVNVLDEDLIKIYRYWKELLKDDFGFGPKERDGISVMSNSLDTLATPSNRTQNVLRKIVGWLQDRNYTLLPPYGAFVFNGISTDGIDVTLMPGGRYGGWTPRDKRNVSKIQLLYPEIDRKSNMINLMSNAFSKFTFGSNGPQITTFTQGMSQKVLGSFDLAGILGVYLLGFAMSFMLPTFISNIVIDRHERILIMMEMSGLKLHVYWVVTVLYNLLIYSIVMASMWISGALFGMKFFIQTDPFLLGSLLLLWGFALNAMAFFFSSFFKTPRSASISGYFIVIFSVIISNLLNGTVYLSEVPPFWFFIYPPFAFYRMIFIMEDACIRLQCLTFKKVEGVSFIVDQFSLVVTMLLTMTLIVFLLAWLRRRAADSEQSPYDACWNLVNSVFGRFKKSSSEYEEIDQDDIEAGLLENINLDEDVDHEKNAVLAGQIIEKDTSLIVKELTKTYSNGFKALKGLSFSLNKGECFGLLGANGAGKTTLISCITGLQSPTTGTAFFGGGSLDLRKDLDHIQSRIGVCMQFDIFYPKLSVYEHLLFYSRLKGVTEFHLIAHVEYIVECVGLAHVKNRQAQFLSGGMRRRLSMGISMIGNPDIIILDEPSTGLDPLTRRQVWKVFSEMRKKREEEDNPVSVILTTHAMDEADRLCDRVGIMSRGSMLCLGTSEYLKQKFSNGYTLSLQFASAPLMRTLVDIDMEKIALNDFLYQVFSQDSTVSLKQLDRDFVTKNGISARFLPDKSLKYMITYQLVFPEDFEKSPDFVQFLKSMFVMFMRAKNSHQKFKSAGNEDLDNVTIKEWGLDRTSLEDVFLRVLKIDHLNR